MRKSFILLAAFSCAGAIAIACGDEETIPNAPKADSGTSPTDAGSGPGPGPGVDAGTGDDDDDLQDAQAVTDGGTNIDPDAGDEEDAGAAACNALTDDAAEIKSRCSSVIPGLTGGVLVAGKYHLQRVDLLAPQNFCLNQFNPTPLSETLDLAVDGAGVGTAQTVLVIGNRPPRTATLTLDPPDDNSSPLQLTGVCPPKPGGKTLYTSALRNQKQILILRLGYGNGGQALYRFEKL